MWSTEIKCAKIINNIQHVDIKNELLSSLYFFSSKSYWTKKKCSKKLKYEKLMTI